jgi:mRNA interferase RelE/StbE
MKPVHRFRVPEPVARTIRGLHPQLKRKLRAALDMLSRDALSGKALHGELEGLRSLRAGRLRVIYRPREPRVIEIVALGPRERIYEETLRLVKSERQE